MEQEKTLSVNLPVQISELAGVLIFASVSIISFFLPFSLGHPQWLVGTVVNACLFLGAIYLPKKYFIPLAILPSLGVLARGIIFGPFTLFLIYFLPFIWLSNLILVLVFIYTTKSTAVGFVVSAFAKFLFLFLAANLYFKFHFVPAIFLQTMGLNQLATALAGGLISLIIFQIYGKFISRSPRP